MKMFNLFKRHVNDYKLTIPEVEEYNSPIPVISDSHDDFNALVTDSDGLTYRIMSEHSKEILRLNCFHQDYQYSNVIDLMSDSDAGKYINSLCKYKSEYRDYYYGEYSKYMKSKTRRHFIMRLFETDNGRHFFQHIDANESLKCTYKITDLKMIGNIINCIETKDGRFSVGPTLYSSYPIVKKPGTYSISEYLKSGDTMLVELEFGTYHICSHEIIDQKKYDKLIEIL